IRPFQYLCICPLWCSHASRHGTDILSLSLSPSFTHSLSCLSSVYLSFLPLSPDGSLSTSIPLSLYLTLYTSLSLPLPFLLSLPLPPPPSLYPSLPLSLSLCLSVSP